MTWDSPIPTGEGESLFVAQVDFTETGQVMADMALSILGEDGGQFAILSASPDAANQNAWIAAMEDALEDPKYANLELLEIVYGDDQSEKSYEQAQALISKHPDMKLIMAPTSVGIVSAAKARAGRGPVRRDQGFRPGRPGRDARVHPERLRAGVRALELRRPRLPDVLRLLPAGDGRRSRAWKARPSWPAAWVSTDHQGPDPAGRRRAAAS